MKATSTATPHFDGWAVVEDKRKGKGKKGEGDDVQSPEIIASVSIPSSGKRLDAEEAGSYFNRFSFISFHYTLALASTPTPEAELYSEVIMVEPRKVGLLIGPKGVTKLAIQEVTGVNITMPRIEKPAEGTLIIRYRFLHVNNVRASLSYNCDL